MDDKKILKIKWCFLVSSYPLLMEFLAKLSYQIFEQADDCFLIVNSKIAEWSKLGFFPKDIRMYSRIDWVPEHWEEGGKDIGDFSWKEFFTDCDRWKLVKFSYKKVVTIISQLYQFIDFVFQKEKPDVVVYGMPGSFFAQVVHYLCRKYNIVYLGLVASRMPHRIDVFDLKYKCSKYEETFKGLNLNKNSISAKEENFAKEFIRNFVSHKKVPSHIDHQVNYSKNFSLSGYLKREKEMTLACLKYFLKRRHFSSIDYESEIQFKYWLRNPLVYLKRKIRMMFPKNVFDSVNDNDKFFFFPVHVQPELSTSGMATYFYNQLNTIINTAFSLPFPYKLYVKAHPRDFTKKDRDFYKKMKRTPNVVYLSPKENTELLLKKSEGVIILSGTMGLEALLAGKPVYALGDVFYYFHPLCRRVDSFEELKQKIEIDVREKSVINDLEDINVNLVLSYFKNTLAGDIFSATYNNDTNDYREIYKQLREKFLINIFSLSGSSFPTK